MMIELMDSGSSNTSLGLLKATGKLSGGQLDGLWKWYRENGKPLQVGRFEDGKQVGLWKRYHENGNLYDVGAYRAGAVVSGDKTLHAQSEVGDVAVVDQARMGQRGGWVVKLLGRDQGW